jgi:nitrate reductase alpha subunit
MNPFEDISDKDLKEYVHILYKAIEPLQTQMDWLIYECNKRGIKKTNIINVDFDNGETSGIISIGDD